MTSRMHAYSSATLPYIICSMIGIVSNSYASCCNSYRSHALPVAQPWCQNTDVCEYGQHSETLSKWLAFSTKSGGVPGLTVCRSTPSWWECINVSSRSSTNVFLWTMSVTRTQHIHVHYTTPYFRCIWISWFRDV